MIMIGHQAIGDNLTLSRRAECAQPAQQEMIVGTSEENVAEIDAAIVNVVDLTGMDRYLAHVLETAN